MDILPKPIEFEWDTGNLEKNFIKHGVTNIDCEDVFIANRFLLLNDKVHSTIENRYIVLGPNQLARILYIVITLRGNLVRIISARVASKKERQFYEATFESSEVQE